MFSDSEGFETEDSNTDCIQSLLCLPELPTQSNNSNYEGSDYFLTFHLGK